jgi:hypothetical protein
LGNQVIGDSDTIKDKAKILNKLISIPEVFTYIHNTNLSIAEQMKNVNIFSRIKVPGTITTVKNYIGFNYSSDIDRYNKSFKNIYITFLIVCHEQDINTSYGNRHDVLGNILLNEFCWSDFMGFELELVSDKEGTDGDYSTRTITFKNISSNNINSGVRA